MKQLMGTGVALVTPFANDGSIDVKALRRIVEHCISGGVDYLVALGTTGESVTLTKTEKQLVIDTVISANNGRLPLVLGVGGNNTALVIEELKTLDLSHFVAILSVSPYYNRPTQEGIYQHFKAIAAASPKPIVVYNVPGRTGSNMEAATTLRLANDCNNIVGIKEASGNMDQIRNLINGKPGNFLIISGDDITALDTVLAGGVGVISVLGQGLPSAFTNLIHLGLEGKKAAALQLQFKLVPGIDLIFQEGNPAGIKSMLEVLGLCSAKVRLPLVEASPALKTKITSFVNLLSKVPA